MVKAPGQLLLMRRMRILNAEGLDYCAEARAVLAGFCTLREGELDRTALLASVGEFDGLIVRLGHRVDEEVLAAAPHLRVLATATTGLDHIDVAAAARLGIEVLSLKGETGFLEQVTATAEHTWALLLALVRCLPEAVADVRAGNWQRDQFRGIELSGRVLGVVGYGRLGRMVARYGVAFGMTVLAADPVLPQSLPDGVTGCDLGTLLATADVVSLHVPLSPATCNLIDAAALAHMRPGSILVNTSRGEIVDMDGLLAALERGAIAGAALDVVPREAQGHATMQAHRLIRYASTHRNLIITPHIGGATFDSMRKTEVFMATKLKTWAGQHGFATHGFATGS